MLGPLQLHLGMRDAAEGLGIGLEPTFLVFILQTVTGASDLGSWTWLAVCILIAHPLKLSFCTVRTGLL